MIRKEGSERPMKMVTTSRKGGRREAPLLFTHTHTQHAGTHTHTQHAGTHTHTQHAGTHTHKQLHSLCNKAHSDSHLIMVGFTKNSYHILLWTLNCKLLVKLLNANRVVTQYTRYAPAFCTHTPIAN